MKHRIFAVGTFLFAVMLFQPLSYAGDAAKAQVPHSKVLVLGFDGADARIIQNMMNEGQLPNLKKLADEGTFHPLLPTNPAQTPVSWSSMATGLNPGKTGIFDFLKREEGSYQPTFALMSEVEQPFLFGKRNPIVLGLVMAFIGLVVTAFVLRRRGWRLKSAFLTAIVLGGVLGFGVALTVGRWLPVNMPTPRNNRHGTTFWQIAARKGLRVKVLRYPTSFPVDKIDDIEMLSGLGVPDVRATIGQPTIYTDDASLLARANEFSLKIELVDTLNMGEELDTVVWGPRNKIYCDTRKKSCREWMKSRGIPLQIKEPLKLKLDLENRQVGIAYRDEAATLKEGQWSDWFVFEFALTPLVKIKAIGRFYLISVDPYFMLYLSPLHFHPDMAARIPFATPVDWVKKLRRDIGLFKTMGWAIDTWTITSGLVGEDHFIGDMKATVEKYREIMRHELEKNDWDLFVMVYSFTDRTQHILWRLIDPQHPLYDPKKAQYYGKEIFNAYKTMDSIVGEALKMVPPDTRVIVVSDHGFTSFRRGVNYTTWLIEHGFMKLKGQVGEVKTLEDLFGGGDFFEQVDWSRTKAYSIGLGPIYINLKGREPHGSVEPGEEYEAVRKAIIEGLENLVDPVTGEKPVYKVYTREEMYGEGFDPDLIPDLRVANTLNYRVDWQTTLGNAAPDVVLDNLKNWSADHCSVEPSLVKGIFFANFPIANDQPSIIDVMPTILQLLGIEIPSGLDGHSLVESTATTARLTGK